MSADAEVPDAEMHGEEAIIQEFLAPLAVGYPGAFGLKDDCAAITPTPEHDLIVKTDPIAEGIHFLPDDAPEHIGWKALAVNVSDLAAKGATPRAYLMALSFPQPPSRSWLERFARGLREAQSAFGMHLVGGDTDRRPGPITISITVLGEVPSGEMLRRGAARRGDLLYVTGTLGAAAIGLRWRLDNDGVLADRWGVDMGTVTAVDEWFPALDAYLRPQPRLGLRTALLGHAVAAMDLSDGLAKDLTRLCKASGCAASVHRSRLPLLPIVRKAVAAEPERWMDVVASGDDYEILAAVPPAHAVAFQAAASRDGVAVTEIGFCRHGSGIEILDDDGVPIVLTRTGWDHF